MEQQEEIWKDIIMEKNGVLYDFTGLYQVSNLGRVRSLNYRGKGKMGIMRPTKRDDGYYIITLHKDNEQKSFRLHRIVATVFIPNPDNLPEVNHKDENKRNNNLIIFVNKQINSRIQTTRIILHIQRSTVILTNKGTNTLFF